MNQVDAAQIVAQLAVQQDAIRNQQELTTVALQNLVTGLQNQGDRARNAASFVKPPKYNGDPDSTNWTTFRSQFTSYANLRWGLEPNEQQINEQKTIAYLSIGKTAAVAAGF